MRSQIPLFTTWFILDAEDWPVPVDTFAQWAEWHAANQERCAIGRAAGRGFLVETRFVGLGYTGGGDPLLYWTTIWMDEAFKGHYLAVQEAKREAALWRWLTRLSAVIAEVDAYPLCMRCIHYGGAGRCRRGWVPARVSQARHCPVREVRP